MLLMLACPAAAPAQPASLASLEQQYADFNDAQGAVSLIDSDPRRWPAYAGRTRAQWQQQYEQGRARLLAGLRAVTASSAEDRRALEVMRAALADSTESPQSLAPNAHCADAARTGQPQRELQRALYACFSELGNHLQFEGETLTRVAAFEQLARIPEAQRRRALFMAFVPLWQAVNAANEAASPYRRMIGRAALEARAHGSAVDAAARTIGAPVSELEEWLQRVLQRWSAVNEGAPVEPWDYRYEAGAAERQLAPAIPRGALESVSARYYRDLGLDLAAAQVLFDLDPRADKAPLAYTDYVRRGRVRAGGAWQPTLVRVSASYGAGGLGALEELVHEDGHAAHMLALRTRPAFMDLGDAVFYEAFADVPAWSVYEPRWQQRYLGHSAPEDASLRAHYAAVMLDVAWALFDCRMLRQRDPDPNRIWTEITQRYLHIRPHPELAWWAMRVQLVDAPGYMVNYGLGAIITADIRQRIAQQIGSFDAGNARWFGWLQQQLLGSGERYPTSELLRAFLGRAVSPQALLEQLERVHPPAGGVGTR
ncbi:MAG TPA: hypothetical protein VMG33_09370 [Steroidobacteraceae bacterium]|nr:hypothetical protein [Steroidobacteraceae bacterium]